MQLSKAKDAEAAARSKELKLASSLDVALQQLQGERASHAALRESHRCT